MTSPVDGVRPGVRVDPLLGNGVGTDNGPIARPGVRDPAHEPAIFRSQPVRGRPGVLPEQGKPSLATLRAAAPDFDFSNVRDFGGYVANSADRGRVEMRAIGDGLHQIQFEHAANGDVRIRYGDNRGEMRDLAVTPQLRAELAQAFRMSAALERAESLRRLPEHHVAWQDNERARATSPHLNPSPEPTEAGIQHLFRSRMEFADVVAGTP